MTLLLKNATLADGVVSDLLLADGVVQDMGTLDGADEVLDLTGHLLLCAPAEPHTHLDKALTADRLGDSRSLPEAVAAWTTYAAELSEADVMQRALEALRELVAHGVTAVRTHANLTSGDDPLVAVRALCAVRDLVRDAVTVQVVALPRHDAPDELIERALDAGADLIGGGPHLAPEPGRDQDRLLAMARRRGVGVDLHTDEHLDVGVGIAHRLAQGEPLPGGVTASHCVSLGREPVEVQRDVAAALAAAGVNVVALPQTNLWLQGRGTSDPTRGLTAVHALLAAGVTLAAGGDNIRDGFNPFGRCDPFETATLLGLAGHVGVEQAWTAVTSAARAVMGLPPAGPEVGLVADLLAVRAGTLRDAIARAPEDRIVIRDGRVVAATRVEQAVSF